MLPLLFLNVVTFIATNNNFIYILLYVVADVSNKCFSNCKIVYLSIKISTQLYLVREHLYEYFTESLLLYQYKYIQTYLYT